jgi:hypothetical protein
MRQEHKGKKGTYTSDWWVKALEDDRNARKANGNPGATVGKDDRRSKEKMYEQQDRIAAVMGLSGLVLRRAAQRRRGKK